MLLSRSILHILDRPIHFQHLKLSYARKTVNVLYELSLKRKSNFLHSDFQYHKKDLTDGYDDHSLTSSKMKSRNAKVIQCISLTKLRGENSM